MSTKIEWTHVPDGNGGFKKGETWNPQVGCREISPACRQCYAAKLAHRGMSPQHKGLTVVRKDGPHWNGEINRVPHLLAQPLKWREPRGVFVGSMTDLFYKVDTDEDCEFIAAIFGIMVACPQHTFMLLTKRPENAAKWFAWLDRQCEQDCVDQVEFCVLAAMNALLDAGLDAEAEQLFDRYGWAKDGDYWGGFEAMEHEDSPGIERRKRRAQRATEGWDAEAWPAKNICFGVTAEDQQRANERIPILLGLPAAVHYASYEPACGDIDWRSIPVPPSMSVKRDFETTYNALAGAECRRDGEVVARGPRLDWIIGGGESGPGARPAHPEWFRSTRDQCVEANVAFFFKQWGEHGPSCVNSIDGTAVFRSFPDHATWVSKASTWLSKKGDVCVDMAGKVLKNGGDFATAVYPVSVSRRLGKSIAGRDLDGRTWDQFPEGAG